MKLFIIIYAIIGLLTGAYVGIATGLNKNKDEDLIQYICMIIVAIPGYVIFWPVGIYMIWRSINNITNGKES